MCERGELPFTLTGRHRRIPRQAVDQRLHPEPRREDERSLWLNLVIAAKLVQDPDGVIDQVKRRLAWLRETHSHGRGDVWLDQWATILDDGPDAVLVVLTERSPTAATLRSTSPLRGLGLVGDDEREHIPAAFRKHWRTRHQSVA